MITGIYVMKLPDYMGSLIRHEVRVEIIGESNKSYKVKLLEPGPLGRPVGTTYWPRKYNVINITKN